MPHLDDRNILLNFYNLLKITILFELGLLTSVCEAWLGKFFETETSVGHFDAYTKGRKSTS